MNKIAVVLLAFLPLAAYAQQPGHGWPDPPTGHVLYMQLNGGATRLLYLDRPCKLNIPHRKAWSYAEDYQRPMTGPGCWRMHLTRVSLWNMQQVTVVLPSIGQPVIDTEPLFPKMWKFGVILPHARIKEEKMPKGLRKLIKQRPANLSNIYR